MIKHRLVWSSNKIHSRDISPQLKFCFIFFQNMFFGASKKILFQRYEFMSGELIVRSVSSYFNIWLVVYLPLLKKMSSSVGMMEFPIYGKSQNSCSETTNQWKMLNINTWYSEWCSTFSEITSSHILYIHQLFQYIFSEVWLTVKQPKLLRPETNPPNSIIETPHVS